jgi:hypothetical protein
MDRVRNQATLVIDLVTLVPNDLVICDEEQIMKWLKNYFGNDPICQTYTFFNSVYVILSIFYNSIPTFYPNSS